MKDIRTRGYEYRLLIITIMKKQLLFILLLAVFASSAQQSIPNGNFEMWTTTTYQNPRYYVNTSNRDMMRTGLPFNCVKVTDAYHGNAAIKLTSVANETDSMFGYMINSDAEGSPDMWHGGIPYSQKPSGIRGYYKSAVAAGDTALIFVAFSKAGVNIGVYAIQITGIHSSYTLFEQTFSPALSEIPDSVIFGATSSNAISEQMVVGSMLQIDSISFIGVTTQPTLLNGDFEDWDNVSAEKPANWFVEESGRNQNGVKRITTAYKGIAAIELTTILDENENGPRARGMNVSTGFYPRNCNQCNMVGGYPFTNKMDTLVFWYKYTPMGGSVAEVGTRLKKNGNIIGGNNIPLEAASSYRYIELPIQSSENPDTLIVEFRSSRWEDSLLMQIGGVLILDEVQLKSQPLNTGIPISMANSKTAVYPNPSNGNIQIDANTTLSTVEVMNILGEVLYIQYPNAQHLSIDLSHLPKGAYFYRITGSDSSVKTGKLLLN